MKRSTVSAAVVMLEQEMNFGILENLSTTTINVSFPFDCGSPITKSNKMVRQGYLKSSKAVGCLMVSFNTT